MTSTQVQIANLPHHHANMAHNHQQPANVANLRQHHANMVHFHIHMATFNTHNTAVHTHMAAAHAYTAGLVYPTSPAINPNAPVQLRSLNLHMASLTIIPVPNVQQQRATFNTLPLEMRKQIWGFASYNIQPRLMKAKEINTDADTTQKFEIIGARRPTLLTVCKEAFAEMTFRRGYKLLFKVAGSNKRIFFSPQIDIIELSSVFEVPKLLLSDALEKKMDIGSVTRVIVGANYLDWSSTQLFHNFAGLHSLREIFIADSISEEGRTEYFHLSFHFEVFVVNELIALMFDLPLGSKKLTPIYALPDGQLKEGVYAMSEIFEHLIDEEQKQHLMEIWSSLDKNFEEFTSLASLDEGFATNNSWPTRVNISIGYLSTVVN